jgi:hypothetical protein
MPGLELRIEGADALHKVSAQIFREGKRNIAREMGTALSKAADPLKVSIRASAAETMPKTGGYSGVFSKSLRFRLERRNGVQQASASLITYADGAGERRDIRALEAGRLRHPVFGRSRRVGSGIQKGNRKANPWAVTSVRAGFHKRGTAHAMDDAQKQLGKVIDDYAERLIE